MDRVSRYERLQIESMLSPRGISVREGVALFVSSESHSSQTLYSAAVGPALRASGLNRIEVVRVFDSDSALVDVTRWIATAEVIVADLSELAGDLMYVVGLAHGLGRCPLLLVERTAGLPFNLAGLRHVEYSRGAAGLQNLRDDLTRAIRVFLAAANASGEAL